MRTKRTKLRTKICSKCKIEKSWDSFNFRNKIKNIKKSACRDCQNKDFSNYIKKKIINHEINKDSEYRICPKCKINKLLREFTRGQSWCKLCMAKHSSSYYKNNKEMVSEKNRQKLIENRKILQNIDKHEKENLFKCCPKCNIQKSLNYFYVNDDWCICCRSSYNKDYRAKNRQILIIRDRNYRNKNKEKLKLQRQIRINNNVHIRIKLLISRRICEELKKHNSSKNNQSIIKYLSYIMQELINYLESLFESWMNWNNFGKYNAKTWNDNDYLTWTWNIDHIIPCSYFKYTSMEDEEFRQCWALENLRPYSAKQNNKDGNRRTIKEITQIKNKINKILNNYDYNQ
jgi:uncharacterized protein (DUF983 family)